MVDVGQFLGLRAAKRAGPSAPAPGRLGIFAAETEPIPQPAVRFSARQIAALFMTLAAIASIPILLYPWPPLSDYINHLARMHVIASIGSDPNLAGFYEVDWQVIPNLMMDLIVPILQRVMNVYLAGQAYTIMTFVLILSGTLALNRQLYGHWSVLPLIAFPLLYNNVFLVGTMNYLFGIGLSLWALATWVALRERAMILRLAVSTLFVLALFFCHLIAVGVYGLALFAFELQRLLVLRARKRAGSAAPRRQFPAWVDFVASGIPFLPVLPLLLMSPTWTLRWDFTWELGGKLTGLLYVIEVYSRSATFFLATIVAIAALFAIRHRALRVHPFGWVLLTVGGLTYLAPISICATSSCGAASRRCSFCCSPCAHSRCRACGASSRAGPPRSATPSAKSSAGPRCWSRMRIPTTATTCVSCGSCTPLVWRSSSAPPW